MELQEKLKSFSDKFLLLRENIQTEEATKNAFIMPFIREVLGYDVFNPLEVIPEFIADAGNKKGEKVDYCIKKDNEAILIIECKHWTENLDKHVSQLSRYYTFTKARFGILTNGLSYRFYSDLDKDNIMDSIPFLKFDLATIKETEVVELKRFNKENFDEKGVSEASLKFKTFNDIKNIFEMDMEEPSEDFVKYFEKKLGKRKKNERDEFTKLIKKAINSKVKEEISHRLQFALNTSKLEEDSENKEEVVIPNENSNLEDINATTDVVADDFIYSDEERGIYTTQEEIDGYNIILDILMGVLDEKRIAYRDTKSYFGILLDDNNRKPICRLYFNSSNKRIALIDDKKEIKHSIKKLEHIYMYSYNIIKTVENYLKNDLI